MVCNGIAIILVRPQLGENIGAAARSMLNFSLTDLRIVAPRDGWPNAAAMERAKGAADIVSKAQLYHHLSEATHDIHTLYATTARKRDLIKPSYSPKACMEDLVANSTHHRKAAVMFGPERTGLTNEELTYANALMHIPVGDVYPSINLAHAVTVISYEYFLTQQAYFALPRKAVKDSEVIYATRKELNDFFVQLESALDQNGFFKLTEKRHRMVNNIRNIFSRNGLTQQEVRTLRGIVTSFTKRKHN